eukprot:NODE_113_length_19319_cov_0.247815.p11 type:complete len:146 gc:universal NODE_113_length_19319_cov_0.247815:12844-13281(+)
MSSIVHVLLANSSTISFGMFLISEPQLNLSSVLSRSALTKLISSVAFDSFSSCSSFSYFMCTAGGAFISKAIEDNCTSSTLDTACSITLTSSSMYGINISLSLCAKHLNKLCLFMGDEFAIRTNCHCGIKYDGLQFTVLAIVSLQ